MTTFATSITLAFKWKLEMHVECVPQDPTVTTCFGRNEANHEKPIVLASKSTSLCTQLKETDFALSVFPRRLLHFYGIAHSRHVVTVVVVEVNVRDTFFFLKIIHLFN